MKILHKYLIYFGLSVLVGVLFAFAFLRILPTTALLPQHPLLQAFGIKKPIVMGFLPYWQISKVSDNSLSTLNNITYFGLTLNTDGTLVRLTSPQETEPGWYALQNGKYTELLSKNSSGSLEKSLLIHLSNEASISALLSNPSQNAQNFINEVEPLMKEYKFTDLNLDIESFREAKQEEQNQMEVFLRKVKELLLERELGTLTTELTVASLVKPQLLRPTVVGEVSDRVVLMAYDFHYRGSYISGAVAPLAGAPEKLEYDVITSIQLATQAIPPEKIILGIPLYGYEWETLSYQPESAVIPGTGKTATAARVSQIDKNCEQCLSGRDELSGSPYVILPPNEESAIQQIYFEDADSIQQKIELAKKYQLAGVALWAMGYENEELLTPLKNYKQTWVWKK